jgi:hypothetical protein
MDGSKANGIYLFRHGSPVSNKKDDHNDDNDHQDDDKHDDKMIRRFFRG